ncbi:MAG: Na+/H+ antiporter subunit E [Elusimicrobia bacterium]|nr:Na+/H+ antiporter subunit E [Elusimicrobiota bacterium]
MKKKIFVFLLLLFVWVLLALPFDIQNFLLGVFVSLFTTLVFGDAVPDDVLKFLSIKRIFAFIKYIFVFLYYMILANLDVMYRVLHPALPIKPGIVKAKTRLTSKFARTMLANSITLTPGTLTVDIEGENLYIHWINVKSADVEEATKIIVEKFEKILEEIFA